MIHFMLLLKRCSIIGYRVASAAGMGPKTFVAAIYSGSGRICEFA